MNDVPILLISSESLGNFARQPEAMIFRRPPSAF
jgi:hypothetical protein